MVSLEMLGRHRHRVVDVDTGLYIEIDEATGHSGPNRPEADHYLETSRVVSKISKDCAFS